MTDSGHACLQEMSENGARSLKTIFRYSAQRETVHEGITIYLEILLNEALIETEAVAVVHCHLVGAGQQCAIHPLLHFLPA